MKTKKLRKTLSLKKVTISRLNDRQLEEVKGQRAVTIDSVDCTRFIPQCKSVVTCC